MSKVFGIGLNRTGTSTLGRCLQQFGYRHRTYDFEAFDCLIAGDEPGLMAIVDQYDSFEDWPWPLCYEQLDARYPDAKFILTTRRSPEAWFRSKCKLAITLGPVAKYEAYVYGHEMPHGHEAEHVAYYEAHNAAVASYFEDRPGKLLKVCWEHGDGWAELAAFLGHPPPEVPFPHTNPGNVFFYTGANAALARINRRLYRNRLYRRSTKKINRLLHRVRRRVRWMRTAAQAPTQPESP